MLEQKLSLNGVSFFVIKGACYVGVMVEVVGIADNSNAGPILPSFCRK